MLALLLSAAGCSDDTATQEAGITSANESTHSFLRQALAGKHPAFVQSDWKVGKKTK